MTLLSIAAPKPSICASTGFVTASAKATSTSTGVKQTTIEQDYFTKHNTSVHHQRKRFQYLQHPSQQRKTLQLSPKTVPHSKPLRKPLQLLSANVEPNSNPTRTISAYKCTQIQSAVSNKQRTQRAIAQLKGVSNVQRTQRSIAQLKRTIEPFISALTSQRL